MWQSDTGLLSGVVICCKLVTDIMSYMVLVSEYLLQECIAQRINRSAYEQPVYGLAPAAIGRNTEHRILEALIARLSHTLTWIHSIISHRSFSDHSTLEMRPYLLCKRLQGR